MSGKRHSYGLLLDRLSPPEGLLLLTLAMIIGAATGLAAVFFIRLIVLIEDSSYSSVQYLFPSLGAWSYILVPVAGALVAGPLIAWFAHEAKGHGVPEVMQALVLRGGRIRTRVAVAKIIASALCIGTGGSAGREGPIVQVGSALGSGVGQILRLSDERIKNLVSCGAAAGIAATFNAPIAGVAFAIEVLMSELQVRMFGNVVISAVAASIVSQMFLGDQPAFTVPAYTMHSPVTLIFFLLLGLAAALVGVLFIRMLAGLENAFDDWKFPLFLKPAAGALLLGMVGFLYLHLSGIPGLGLEPLQPDTSLIDRIPHLYGSGFAFIEQALNGTVPFRLLALLIIIKPIATSFTLGSGNSGGVFAPSLFTGAMLGGAMGSLFAAWNPELAGPPGAYALVGMAAVFAACARAPLTAMLIVFEMSNDYSLILPLMVSAITASYLAQVLYQDSIYTSKLSRRGIRFSQGRDMDVMQGVLVREVMNNVPISVNKNQSLAELYQRFQETNFLGFPVLDEQGRLWGIVTLQDMEKVLSQDALNLRGLDVSDVAVRNPITVYPDEPIWSAIQKMSPRDLARLPVVSRHDRGKLLGLISRSNILRAYDVAIVRKQRGQMLERQTTLRREGSNAFIEFRLQQQDHAVGRMLQDIFVPAAVTVVSVERGGDTLIPRGQTAFRTGDIITLFGDRQVLEETKEHFLLQEHIEQT